MNDQAMRSQFVERPVHHVSSDIFEEEGKGADGFDMFDGGVGVGLDLNLEIGNPYSFGTPGRQSISTPGQLMREISIGLGGGVLSGRPTSSNPHANRSRR
jgi:hypothetical protein